MKIDPRTLEFESRRPARRSDRYLTAVLLIEGFLLLLVQVGRGISGGLESQMAGLALLMASPAVGLWFLWFAASLIEGRPVEVTVRSLMVLAATVAILGIFGVRWFRAAREERELWCARRCMNNIKYVQSAFQNYYLEHGHFPPAYLADENGTPMHSWRVLILPYMEEKSLYSQYRFGEPWDGPNNRKLADKVPDLFHCPIGPHGEDSPFTDYVVVVGPNTMFPGAESVSWDDVTDGTENTITIVEIESSDIHWVEPRDLRFDELCFAENGKAKRSTSSPHPTGVTVGFADGTRSHLPRSLPPGTWRALLTRSGGEDVARESVEAR